MKVVMHRLMTVVSKNGSAQFIRFTVVGALNTGMTYLLFALLSAVIPYTVAYTIVYVAGIFISYVLNTRFVFRTEFRWRSLFAYPIVYVIQYAIGIILLPFLVEILKLDRLVAAPIVIVTTLPITFIASRFILRNRPVKGVSS